MFIIQKELSPEAKVFLRVLKRKMGSVPPHFEFFATVNFKRFKMFIDEISYIANHPNISSDFFTFIRYYISTNNGFDYCVSLNSNTLLEQGYSKTDLQNALNNQILPLEEKFTTLFTKTIKAIEKPQYFCKDDLQELYKLGFSDIDIWDSIDHAAFLFKFYKLLNAYKKA